MIKKCILTALVLTCVSIPANAKTREIKQAELRSYVSSGKSISVKTILSRVRSRVKGDVIDVRAFDAGGVYYRVLVMMPNGRVGSVVVNGRTGQTMSASSTISKAVQAAAKSSGRGGAASSNSANGGNGGGNGRNN